MIGKVLVATLGVVYLGGALYAKKTGAFGVGPSAHVQEAVGGPGQPGLYLTKVTQADVDNWEKERTRRALRWPLSFIPSPFTG